MLACVGDETATSLRVILLAKGLMHL